MTAMATWSTVLAQSMERLEPPKKGQNVPRVWKHEEQQLRAEVGLGILHEEEVAEEASKATVAREV